MRIYDSGFKKRTVKNYLMTRQLILSTRESKKKINNMGTQACTFKQLWDNVVGCPIFLEIQNPWGKVMERSGFRFEKNSLEVV